MVSPAGPSAPPGPASPETTQVLLSLARAGDDAARERLFARFLPKLEQWAHRRLPHSARGLADTDDLVQVTLVRALNRLDAFEPRREGAFLAYIRTIPLNVVREDPPRAAAHAPRSARRARLQPLALATGRPSSGAETLERYDRPREPARGAARGRDPAARVRTSHAEVAEALGKSSPTPHG
jgi:RNA polymerase sigma-70 factor (ECF subfamily)